MASEQVILSFLEVEDSRVVLVFDTASNAEVFSKKFDGRADIFDKPTHVLLSKPSGLTLAMPSKKGEMVYVFSSPEKAQTFAKKLEGHGFVGEDATSVVIGRAWNN